MLRKALNLSDMPYKSGCICSETEGRRAPFCPSCPRLGGNAPKSEAADVLARAIFIRFLAFLGGDAPNFVLIFSLVVAVEYRLFHILSHFYPYITFLIRADFAWIYPIVFL